MRRFISTMAIAIIAVTTSVRIPQPVTANGEPLAPGTYGLRITDDRPPAPSGQPNESQRWVEFVADGMVVARTIAELIPADEPRPVGTSASSGEPRAVVQLLKGGDFLRVSVREGGARYLVHLPTSTTAVQP